MTESWILRKFRVNDAATGRRSFKLFTTSHARRLKKCSQFHKVVPAKRKEKLHKVAPIYSDKRLLFVGHALSANYTTWSKISLFLIPFLRGSRSIMYAR